jgi:hypothetical protein
MDRHRVPLQEMRIQIRLTQIVREKSALCHDVLDAAKQRVRIVGACRLIREIHRDLRRREEPKKTLRGRMEPIAISYERVAALPSKSGQDPTQTAPSIAVRDFVELNYHFPITMVQFQSVWKYHDFHDAGKPVDSTGYKA